MLNHDPPSKFFCAAAAIPAVPLLHPEGHDSGCHGEPGDQHGHNRGYSGFQRFPIAITTNPAHNFSTGQRLTIAGVGGNTAANGTWTITVVDSTHFTLSGSTGSGAYTSGGTVSSAAAWFVLNEWYRQTYYAASTGYLPGGPGACNPLPGTPSCLTVNNIASPNNDKRAILVLAGRALDGSTRPSANLSGYLEGENLTPADSIFEHRQGSPTSINDRVVVLSP